MAQYGMAAQYPQMVPLQPAGQYQPQGQAGMYNAAGGMAQSRPMQQMQQPQGGQQMPQQQQQQQVMMMQPHMQQQQQPQMQQQQMQPGQQQQQPQQVSLCYTFLSTLHCANCRLVLI